MKSIYINTVWLLLIALCVGVAGCEKEALPVVAKGEPAYISLSTKALGLGDSKINTVRVMLINPDANHMIELNEFVDSPADPLIIPVMTGTYDVYVVANEEADGSENTALSNVYNLPTLRAVSLPFTHNKDYSTNISMIGEVKNVTITAPASGVPSSTNLASVSIGGVEHGTKLPVELERMMSKLNVKIISKYKLLDGMSILMPMSISLFEGALPPFPLIKLMDVDKSLLTLTESDVDQAKHIMEFKDIVIPSHVFAPVTDISNAMTLGIEIPTHKYLHMELGHLISGATKDYTIKRNHNYEITVTIIEKMIFTNITLIPWNAVDEDFEVL